MDKLFKKKYLLRTAVPLLVLALIFSAFAFLFTPKRIAEVSAAPTLSTLSFENNEFENSSGSFPASPTGWTQSTGTGVGLGSSVAGVLDPSAYNTTDNKETSRLEKYDEFKDGSIPKTPFGKTNDGLGGGAKFLMINTDETTTAVKYTSSEVTLNANSFYALSAWVRTSDFTEGTGASIRLNGLDGNYAFNKINTVRGIDVANDTKAPMESGTNLYGWRKYTFYIATSPLGNKTVSVSLGIGDEYISDDERDVNFAKGFAFFDMVEGRELSASAYNILVSELKDENPYYQVINPSLDTAFVSDAEKKSFAFASTDNWNYIGYSDGTRESTIRGDVSGEIPSFGLDKAPSTSIGELPNTESKYVKANEYLQNILIISSFKDKIGDTKNYNEVYRGVESKNELTVPMFSYRRLSVWVKTDGVDETSGADIVLKTNKKVSGGENDEYREFVIENVSGDEDSAGRHGWKEYSFYIQGSSIEEYSFSLILRLGSSETDKARGTVMFHNIRYDNITSTEFSDNSANGTIVSIDGTFANNDAGVTNGAFFLAGDYDEYKYPLAPASWTKLDASSAAWDGFSSNASHCDLDNVISGIVPTGIDYDAKEYAGMFDDFAGYGIYNPRRGEPGNVLVISSKNPTALGYRSSDITLSASTASKLSVTLKADIKNGYGANLVLKSGSKVISTIENITSTHDFETFTFYVDGNASEQTLSVELWLGMLDRNKNNNSKLSSGTVYFSQVSFEALADGESYATYKAAYEESVRFGGKVKSGVYTFNAEDFTAYDYYSGDVVKYPYNWTLSAGGNANVDGVVYGIFDSTSLPAIQSEIPEKFRNSQDASNNGVLYLHNVSPTASRLTLANGYTVTAGNYYKLSVTLKTDIGITDDTAIGAGVELTGTDFKFSNIKSTSTVRDQIIDDETFKTFEFFILGGSEDQTVSVAITLGGSEYTNQYCSGRVYVNNITFTDIDNVQYDDAVEKLDDPDVKTLDVAALESGKATIIKADLSTPSDSGDGSDSNGGGNASFNWWLIPSILFSVALLIAIVGIVVRKIMDSRAKKHVKVEKVSGYDRKNTLNVIHNEKAEKGDKVKASRGEEKAYSEFDDDATEKTEPKKTEKEIEETEETAPVEDKPETAEETVEEQSAEEPAESNATESTETTQEQSESESAPAEDAPIEEKVEEQPVKEEVKTPEPAKDEKQAEKETTATKTPDPYVDEFDD